VSSGVRGEGVSVWISSWLSLPVRVEERFKEVHLWQPPVAAG
jgi:hypothetical protein